MKSVDKLNKKIEEIIKTREKELTENSNELEEAKIKLASAEKTLIDKTKAGSTKEYIDAKMEYDKSKDIVSMLEHRIEAIKDGALISEEEYQAEVKKVKDECEKIVSSDKTVVIQLLKQLWEIYKSESEELDMANAALRAFQRDIYRNEDCKINGVVSRINIQEFKDYSIVSILSDCFMYDDIKKLIGVKDFTKKVRVY